MEAETIFRIICGATVLIMIVYYLRRRHRIRSVLFGALTGLAALIIVNNYGDAVNLIIPMNAFNVSGSIVLGIPFVICLILIQILG